MSAAVPDETAVVDTPAPVAPTPRWRTWHGVALIVIAVLVGVGWIMGARAFTVADGTMTFPSAPPWSSAGVVVAEVAGQPGDLRVGDQVVAIDGVQLTDWVAARPDRTFRVGERVVYQVVRDGATIPVEVTLVPYPLREKVAAHVTALPLMVLMLIVGSFVFLSRPFDRAARTLFGLSAILPLTSTAWPLGTQVIDLANGPRVWPFVIGDTVTVLVWATLLYFTLLFPQARGVDAHRPWSVAAVFLLPFALHAGYLAVTLPGSSGALERLGRLVPVSLGSAQVVPFLIAGVLGWQYVAARDPEARRRLRWVFATMGVIVVLYEGLGQLPDRLLDHPLVPWDWVPIFFAPFPVVLGAAILRYRLFDIQIILRRSLVYGTLTVLLVGLYVGCITLFRSLTESPNSVAPLVATALVAVLFQPLRARLRRVVSRLFFGDRDDPYQVLEDIGRRLESAASPDAILEATVTSLAETLRLSYAAIELRRGDALIPAANVGVPTTNPVRVPLVHRGEEVGSLLLDAGPGREPFGPADHRLLDGVARQIAMTAQNVQLSIQLQRSLEQVVTAREEERRRLRRDIHDGLGPVLAAGSMHLEVARRVLRDDPDRADTILSTLAENQQAVLVDVRRLVDALRPPVLDQLGLVMALRERARQFTDGGRLKVDVEADEDLEPLPAAVEVAVFHIVLEALTNVVRHAAATTCQVRLWRDRALLVEVRDDGRGLPDSYRAGVGLNSIRERAGQLGGSATITAGSGGGTVVQARLPLPAS